MGPLELIEKLINEHGSAHILRERLELLKTQLAGLEQAHRQAQATAETLRAELDQAQTHAEQLQSQLEALQSGLLATHVCSHCGSGQLQRIGTRPSPTVFGQAGLREAVLRCKVCQGVTHIELPLHG